MKVGILTFHFATNYGAVFQAFALKSALKLMGYEAEIINYCPLQMQGGWDYYYYKRKQTIHWDTVKRVSVKGLLLEIFNYLKFVIYDNRYVLKKFDTFEYFISNNLCDNENKITNHDELKKVLLQYDAVICGSDQIWNPKITKGFDDAYFTGRLLKIRSISYAASIGDITVLNDEITKNSFIERVKEFNSVSVRESNLHEMLKTNGINNYCHCDPTFLLKQEDYSVLLKEQRKEKRPYILVYHLLYDKKMIRFAYEIAEVKNLKVIVVNGTLNSRLGSNNCTSPNDFLALLKNATVVITNSFHGIALSLIFHRDFFVFMPQAHRDRIYNLLNLYGLQGRIVKNDFEGDIIPEIDYSGIEIISSDMRNKALIYLNEALS